MRMTISLVLAILLVAVDTARADTSVTVVVSGVTLASGSQVLSVFDSPPTWLPRPIATASIGLGPEIGSEPVEIHVTLPPGRYGFNVYHDVDGDGKMKTNVIGIPKEPIGPSNDAKGRFGPPKFDDAAVEIGEGPETVPINLVEI